jgi:beta-lactamase class D
MFKISTYALVFSLFLFACSPNNIKIDPAITKIMDSTGVKGVFAILENGSGQFTMNNLALYKDSSYAPLNTFFAIPTLIAINKGYINQDSTKWVSFDSVNYYKYLISKLGRESIMKTKESLFYGKGIATADGSNYWENKSLVITPDEQLGFIKKLYFKQLPSLNNYTQEIFKKMIVKENNANYKLSYINGSDINGANAWYLGYLEEQSHPYFFVMHINSTNNNKAINDKGTLLKRILLQQGLLQGVK